MRRLLIFYAATVLAFVATTSFAVPTTDSFSVRLVSNQSCTGDGSGYNDGTGFNQTPWYYNDNTDSWNQWFYDDPPDPTRWKEITYDIRGRANTEVMIAIKWSTLAFPETGPDGPPPLPPMHPSLEDLFIVREVLSGVIWGDGNWHKITGTYIIPDYNPEWVSIDVIVLGGFGSYAEVYGTITHECIPSPGAIVLSSIGVGFVAWLKRRRTL